MTTITATVNDVGRTVAFVLKEETAAGVFTAVDLDGESITAKFDPVDGGATLSVTGLTGTSVGVVATPLDDVVDTAGRYWLTWKVVGGATYPSSLDDRPILIVNPEA